MEKNNMKMELAFVKEKLDTTTWATDALVDYKWYEVGGYQVVAVIKKDGTCVNMCISKVSDDAYARYLPEIYFRCEDCDNDEAKIAIQTVAYGALSPEDIKKVMDGYNTALEVVELLTEAFITK